jgi:hypothetical protein
MIFLAQRALGVILRSELGPAETLLRNATFFGRILNILGYFKIVLAWLLFSNNSFNFV